MNPTVASSAANSSVAPGREQSGARHAVVVQSDLLPLSTLLVAPTSTSARPASFRPEIVVAGRATRVLVEQTAAVDPTRLGAPGRPAHTC
jgi:mRNA interferase MazF